tara:strand:- start:9663 stop:10049 length:387 start_codon:yes stop_codon:yes gene_type:complete
VKNTGIIFSKRQIKGGIMSLTNKDCVKTKADTPKLPDSDIKKLLKETPSWAISHDTEIPHLARDFSFSDYLSALKFINKVGIESDKQDHHPKITLEWGLVRIEWWTHSIGGLHTNDFIMAYLCDRMYG